MGAEDQTSVGLNENHLRRLYATCNYVDKLLVAIESILNVSESDALFHRYQQTLPSATRAGIIDNIQRLRESMVETLAGHGIGLPAPSGDPAYAIRADLQFIDDALEELLPRHMKGYGELTGGAAASLEAIVRDLRAGVATIASLVDAARHDQTPPPAASHPTGEGSRETGPLRHSTGIADPVLNGLAVLVEVADALGASGTADEGRRLMDRLGRGRFYLACLGQFKRGKSTLLNALVGHPVLPTGVTPVTSAITVLQYDEREGALVRFADRTHRAITVDEVSEYVSERLNPGNAKGVVLVEISLPSPALADGLCLVDTPGLGSVFTASTETTRAFVPAIDAALVVVGSDPPVTGDELDQIAAVADRTGPPLIVLSKADRSDRDDQDEAAAFAERVIAERIGRAVPPPLRVSAAERLAGRVTRDWALLESRLDDLRRRSSRLLVTAGRRQARRLADLVERDIAAQRDALGRPLEESEARLARLRDTIDGADTAVRELGALCGVERERLRAQLAAKRDQFLSAAPGPARDALAQALDGAAPAGRRRFYQSAVDAACNIARAHVAVWMQAVEPEIQAAYRALMHRFVELGERFVRNMSATRAIALGSLSTEALSSAELSLDRDFYFTELRAVASPGFWAWLVDVGGPRRMARAVAKRSAERHLHRLLATNSARVVNDLDERVVRSQAALESDIRLRLEEAAELASRAFARAKIQYAAGSAKATSALLELDQFEARVRAVTVGLREEPSS